MDWVIEHRTDAHTTKSGRTYRPMVSYVQDVRVGISSVSDPAEAMKFPSKRAAQSFHRSRIGWPSFAPVKYSDAIDDHAAQQRGWMIVRAFNAMPAEQSV